MKDLSLQYELALVSAQSTSPSTSRVDWFREEQQQSRERWRGGGASDCHPLSGVFIVIFCTSRPPGEIANARPSRIIDDRCRLFELNDGSIVFKPNTIVDAAHRVPHSAHFVGSSLGVGTSDIFVFFCSRGVSPSIGSECGCGCDAPLQVACRGRRGGPTLAGSNHIERS